MRDWGTYRKLYETVSPSFERLPFAARCLAAELLRRADRTGRVLPIVGDMDDQAIDDLAFMVRAHPGDESFIRDGVRTLLDDGYLVVQAQWLTIRNFAEAQLSDSALRMRRARCGASDASDVHTSPSRVLPDQTRPDPDLVSGEVQSKTRSVVSEGGSGGKQSAARKRPRTTSRPEFLSESWEPDSELVSALATEFEVTTDRISRVLPDFRWYWTKGKGAGTRRNHVGWNRTFRNRVAALAKSGELYASEIRGSKPPGLELHEATRLDQTTLEAARKRTEAWRKRQVSNG